jgi:GTP cyclohydrolase I
MSRKQMLKRRGRTRVLALGVAGALSIGGNASASTSSLGTSPVTTLAEEEISDVSLVTFHAFDKESAGAHRTGIRLSRGGRSHSGCNYGCGCHHGGCHHGGCEMIMLRGIPFESHCEHHMAPILGRRGSLTCRMVEWSASANSPALLKPLPNVYKSRKS